MNNIGIRVDANEKIAMGHLMRCMSIALQLKKSRQSVLFILSEQYAEEFILQKGFACVCLSHVYAEKEMELKELTGLIAQKEIACLLIDSYDVSFRYMQELRNVCRTVYIDDLRHFEYPADLTVHYIFGTEKLQPKLQNDVHKKVLLGAKYAPLREEFSEKGIQVKNAVERAFITTGGTDPYDMTAEILNCMRAYPNMEKHAVAGKFYHNLPALRELAMADASIHIYHDIPDVCRIMKKCDLAISAGGGTLVELCACGVPTVCFSIADNQLQGIRALSEAGMALYAGDVRESKGSVIREIMGSVGRLKDDFALREEMGRRGKEAIDGKGASRIALEIMRLAMSAAASSQP